MQTGRIFSSVKYVASMLAYSRVPSHENIRNLRLLPVCRIQTLSRRNTSSSSIDNTSAISKPTKPARFSFLRKFIPKLSFFDMEKARLIRVACLMYENTVDKIDYNVFYKDFNMADTFFSWFLITELHVWMLMTRLMSEQNYGKDMSIQLVRTMWDDSKMRTSKLGSVKSSVKNKQLHLLYKQFYAAIISYDEGIMSDDKVLAGALWKRFFVSECNDPEQLEKLLIYVRKQINMLDKLPSQHVLSSPVIPWIELRSVKVQI